MNKKDRAISKKEEIRKIVEDYSSLPDLSFRGGTYRKVYKLAKRFYFNECNRKSRKKR